MIAATVIAAALSLASTNDYVFTTPTRTNLVGVGMGESGDYRAVRYEDLAFLREAYSERAAAIRPETFATGSVASAYFPAGDFGLYGGFGYLTRDLLRYLMPESYDERDHRQWARGENNSFVAHDFALPAGRGFISCDENWEMVIDGERHDLQRDYIPLVLTFGTRLRPLDLTSNGVPRAVCQLVITNGYHNLTLMHDIVTHPQEGVLSTNDIDKTVSGAYQYDSVTYDYTYVYNSGGQIVDRYRSSVSSIDREFAQLPQVVIHYPPTRMRESISPYYERRCDIGWRLDNPDEPDPLRRRYVPIVFPAHVQRWDYYRTIGGPARKLQVWCPLITEETVSLCSNVQAYAVCGCRRTAADTVVYSRFADSVTATNEWGSTYACMTVELPDLQPVGTFATGGRNVIVWETKGNFANGNASNYLSFVRDYFGDGVSPAITMPTPDTSTIPSSYVPAGRGLAESVGARHTVEREWEIAWVHVVFLFRRDFRAKVIDN